MYFLYLNEYIIVYILYTCIIFNNLVKKPLNTKKCDWVLRFLMFGGRRLEKQAWFPFPADGRRREVPNMKNMAIWAIFFVLGERRDIICVASFLSTMGEGEGRAGGVRTQKTWHEIAFSSVQLMGAAGRVNGGGNLGAGRRQPEECVLEVD